MYANNYQDQDNLVEFFDDPESAMNVFKKGLRMAKGTTSEKGISESFFANPFGPVQRQAQTEVLLEQYFNAMFDQGIKVGQIFTRLGMDGKTKTGPESAARQFLSLL